MNKPKLTNRPELNQAIMALLITIQGLALSACSDSDQYGLGTCSQGIMHVQIEAADSLTKITASTELESPAFQIGGGAKRTISGCRENPIIIHSRPLSDRGTATVHISSQGPNIVIEGVEKNQHTITGESSVSVEYLD